MNKKTPSRDSFVFYRSFYEAIKELPQENQLEIYNAIAEYSLNFVIPELTGISKTIFILIKPQIEANQKRYINGTKPKRKQTVSKTEAKQKQLESRTGTNVNDNVNDNEEITPSSDSDIKAKPESDIPDFIQKELKPFFNLKNLSNAFQFLNSLNGEYESFKQQFFDYKLFQETSKQYKKSFGSFCNKWNETDFKASLNDLKEIKNDSEKNHFPDMQSQKVKNVNGKTVYRVIPDANGKPIINPNF